MQATYVTIIRCLWCILMGDKCDGAEYTGFYDDRGHPERKPVMNKARRKVLNLLECYLELEPAIPSVATLFCILEREDIEPWSDEQMVAILESRISGLMEVNREVNRSVVGKCVT